MFKRATNNPELLPATLRALKTKKVTQNRWTSCTARVHLPASLPSQGCGTTRNLQHDDAETRCMASALPPGARPAPPTEPPPALAQPRRPAQRPAAGPPDGVTLTPEKWGSSWKEAAAAEPRSGNVSRLYGWSEAGPEQRRSPRRARAGPGPRLSSPPPRSPTFSPHPERGLASLPRTRA